MPTYIGVDVSLKYLEVAYSGRKGSVKFPNTPAGIANVTSWLKTLDTPQVILEPTSNYHHQLVQVMAKENITYTCINPARTAAYARFKGKRAKTDKIDAQLLAEMGENEKLRPTPPPDEAQEELKALRRHKEWVEEQLQGAKNRLEAAKHSPWTPRSVVRSLEGMIMDLEKQLREVEKDLKQVVIEDERWQQEVELLMTVPEVGWTTAVLLLSEMPPVFGCKSAKSWSAYAGINPELRESGKPEN